jgi:hypothetical protein
MSMAPGARLVKSRDIRDPVDDHAKDHAGAIDHAGMLDRVAHHSGATATDGRDDVLIGGCMVAQVGITDFMHVDCSYSNLDDFNRRAKKNCWCA